MKEKNPQYVERLIALRKRLRLTQAEFAIAAGITKPCLANWEDGRGRPWNRTALDRLAATFGCEHPSDLESLRLIATCDENIISLHAENKARAAKLLTEKLSREEEKKPDPFDL